LRFLSTGRRAGFDQVLREEALMLIAAMDRHYLTDVASTVG
jgi:hypothetical protein